MLRPELLGTDALDQVSLDRLLIELDGTSEQVEARRECAAGRLAGGGQGSGG